MPGQVKAILPKDFNDKAVTDILQAEMKKFAPFLVKTFEHTTDSWQGEKPKFTPVFRKDGGALRIQVRLAGPKKGREKWLYVNYGTRPHKIKAKPGNTLRFQTGYQAGSTPGQLRTARSSKSGSWRSAKEVNHPGTEARNWKELIIKDYQVAFERWMGAAMSHAARASGHAVK